jgi:hypothetical protein
MISIIIVMRIPIILGGMGGSVGAAGGSPVSTGQTVVYMEIVSVVVLPIGQSVTVGWHDVMVYVIVVYTVSAVIGGGVFVSVGVTGQTVV